MRLSTLMGALAVATCTALVSVAFAQAPAGSTGECKDGTYTKAESKRGACRGHGGVKDWYAETAPSAKKESKSEAKSSPTATAPPATSPASGATGKSATETKSASKTTTQGMRAEAAAGGGAGKVWVNTSSHVYHCMGDEWYGKTKQGEYMTEADAKASGARPSHGKACKETGGFKYSPPGRDDSRIFQCRRSLALPHGAG